MLIDITPVMTSNTTPAPYVASGDSIFSSNYDYYKAFNNTLLDAYDGWGSEGSAGWIAIDFGTEIKIDAFSVSARFDSTEPNNVTVTPRDFELLGSHDGINYTVLKTVTSQMYWQSTESRLYTLDTSYTFRHYKLVISTNNGHSTAVNVGLLKFFQDDGVQEHITNKKASLNYCLPKNSTLAMTQRVNDSREGLLGFSNDADDRYGTLYMINNKGKAIIPKASMAEADVLFDGVANVVGTAYTLNKSLSDYKAILVVGDCMAGTEQQAISNYIPISYIEKVINTGSFTFALDSSRRLFWVFNNDYSFTIGMNENGMRIRQIVGYH